jgi:hypothetical protein
VGWVLDKKHSTPSLAFWEAIMLLQNKSIKLFKT